MEPIRDGDLETPRRSRWVRHVRHSLPLLVAAAILVPIVVVMASCGGEDDSTATEGSSPEPTANSSLPDEGASLPQTSEKVAEGPLAPDVEGIHAWLNSEPLSIPELRGQVVLVDFWTYTCVNCIRTFPFLREWHARYADDGLVILGIHTPEFEFEEDLDNVTRATVKHGIVWPVALDNDYATWNAFRNNAWPSKYLIDKDGVVRYTHRGEGKYAETEQKIRELLVEAGADLSLETGELPEDQKADESFLSKLSDPEVNITPELYAGYVRGCNPRAYAFAGHPFVGHPEYCQSIDEVSDYKDPQIAVNDFIFLQGPWYAGPESLRYASQEENDDFSDYLAVRLSAKSVNAVIKSATPGDPFKVLVTLDGEYLTGNNKGEDVVIEEDGRSFLLIDEPKMYRIVEAPSFDTYDLKLSPNSPRFSIFAFTFGVYESGV